MSGKLNKNIYEQKESQENLSRLMLNMSQDALQANDITNIQPLIQLQGGDTLKYMMSNQVTIQYAF